MTALSYRAPSMPLPSSVAKRACSIARGRTSSALIPLTDFTFEMPSSSRPIGWKATSMSGSQAPGRNGCSIE